LVRHRCNQQTLAAIAEWRALLVAHVLQQLTRARRLRAFNGNVSGEDHMSKRIIALAATFLALCAASFGAGAGPQFTVALQGYDPLSYFEGSTPQKGDFMHAVHWNGATWLFTSDEHAKRFKENPAKYAPQFDGYCAFAASRGYKAPGEALTGVVVDGKLYLNFNDQAKTLWSEDRPGNIKKGEANWPKLNTY
jgi:YHS domain-containing protein